MCEQTPVNYKDGDVVWVKLGSCWWPGEVQDLENLPQEWLADFKKPPITAVKFFDEDKYEYVKSIDKIYSYNCSKKNDFIKKGLDLHRAKHSFMKKFPDDICTAEKKTSGNPNILNDSIFTPEKKENVSALLFDTTTKSKKRKAVVNRRSKNSSTVDFSPSKTITHPRFVGQDDHEVRILVQTRDQEESTSQDELYNCGSCGFKTSRIDVIILHNKSHIQGTYNTVTSRSRNKTKAAKKVVKMIPSKTSSIMEDLAMIDKGLPLYSKSTDEDSMDEWKELTPKRKRRKTKPKVKKVVQPKKETDVVKVDIRNNLLAEWEDDSENEDTEINTTNTSQSSEVTLNESQLEESKSEASAMQVDKSCFDFEEENEDNKIVDAPTGRKIPRVIPPSNKQKTTDSDSEKVISPKVLDSFDDENLNKGEKSDYKYQDPSIEAFQDILNITAVPELPEVPQALKSEQNFHNARTIKFPDKLEIESKGIGFENKSQNNQSEPHLPVSPLIDIEEIDNVKSVQNVKQELIEIEKKSDYINKLSKVDDDRAMDNAFRSNIEELTEALCKQDIEVEIAPLSDTNKIALVNQNVSKLSEDKQSQESASEIAVKHLLSDSELKPKIINPKKRFVKSFEDFEQQLNSENKKGEHELLVSMKESFDNELNKSCVEVSKLKTQLKHKLEGCEKAQNDVPFKKAAWRKPVPKKTVSTEVMNLQPKDEPKSEELVVPEETVELDTLLLEKQVTKTEAESPVKEEQDVVKEEVINSGIISEENLESDNKFYNLDFSEILPENDSKIDQFCSSNNKVVEDLSALTTLAAISELSPNLNLQSSTSDITVPVLKELPKSEEKAVMSSSFCLEDTSNAKSDTVSEIDTTSKEEILSDVAPLEKKSIEFKTSTYDNSIKVKKVDVKQAQNAEAIGSQRSNKFQVLLNKRIDVKSPLHQESGKLSDIKSPKYIAITKKSIPAVSKLNKPIILSEKVIKPTSESETVSVQKVSSKLSSQCDFEDIDAYIIQKSKPVLEEPSSTSSACVIKSQPPSLPRGKAKILQQTIIKPTGDIVKPECNIIKPNCSDEFDINSMPIVLDDQILTTESIQNMPIVLSDSLQSTSTKTIYTPVTTVKTHSKQVKLLNSMSSSAPMLMKTYASQKLIKSPKVFQTISKGIKTTPTAVIAKSKPEKFIIVSSVNTASTPSKYTVGKRPLIKKTILPTTSTVASSSRTQLNSEPTGNKIMIVTNQQGQQSRVLLTPSQQKLLGYQTAKTKLVRNTLKNNILLKSTPSKSATSSTLIASPASSNTISHAFINSDSTKSSSSQQIQLPKLDSIKPDRKFEPTTKKIKFQEGLSTLRGQQKTIVIKNQQGQIVKKIQGTDDALLEQQVAEQVQAIKASGGFNTPKPKQEIKTPIKRSYPKKVYQPPLQSKVQAQATNSTTSQQFETSLPPLAPISPKTEKVKVTKPEDAKAEASKDAPAKALNQLIIQDDAGYRTTITEGQILALPSGDTVDGQPQSYMLVTLDESGNLAPLNNEALLSLDPNLCLGGDLSNVVLQIDNETNSNKQDIANVTVDNSAQEAAFNIENRVEAEPEPTPLLPTTESAVLNISTSANAYNENIAVTAPDFEAPQVSTSLGTIACNVSSDSNRQLIITGDPESTQKFLESLTEGNQDLANLLASAEGNIIIQADEQQILINQEPKPEEKDSSIYSSSSSNHNQDILAAALADSDMFQLETKARPKIAHASQISPSGLYPNVTNLLDTTLSLSSPIMTPLEVPSSNNKKVIEQEADILTTEVPKNVDLPITITDPNIAQTVSQQQVASLLLTELTNNLELPLAVTEQPEPVGISTSSYEYALPTLEDPVSSCSKIFSSAISMPLLTEDTPSLNIPTTLESLETTPLTPTVDDPQLQLEEEFISAGPSKKPKSKKRRFLARRTSDDGLCTLGGEMCSSLSEPPPDTFDLEQIFACSKNYKPDSYSPSHEMNDEPTYETETDVFDKQDNNSTELDNDSTSGPSKSEPLLDVDENSCEIPVQPQIVTDLTDSNSENVSSNNTSSDSLGSVKKKLKLH